MRTRSGCFTTGTLCGQSGSRTVNHGEALPAAQINKRLELEFSMNIERLGELWLEGAEFVEGPVDYSDDETLEVDQEIADDLLEFIKKKMKRQDEEESLFRSIVSEN